MRLALSLFQLSCSCTNSLFEGKGRKKRERGVKDKKQGNNAGLPFTWRCLLCCDICPRSCPSSDSSCFRRSSSDSCDCTQKNVFGDGKLVLSATDCGLYLFIKLPVLLFKALQILLELLFNPVRHILGVVLLLSERPLQFLDIARERRDCILLQVLQKRREHCRKKVVYSLPRW